LARDLTVLVMTGNQLALVTGILRKEKQ